MNIQTDMIERQINVSGDYNNYGNATPDNQTNLPIPNELFEKAIDNFLQETVTPAIQPYKDALIQRFKFAFNEIENEIERTKEETRYEFMNYHFEKIQKKMKEDGATTFVQEASKAESVEKAELIKEWIDGIGNINEKDTELSDIWEGWFLEMNKDPKISEQKRALEVMKELSAEEAKMMLSFNYRYIPHGDKKMHEYKRNKRKLFFFKENKKEKFISNQLINKGLIEQVSILNRINPIFLKVSALYFICAIISLLFFVFYKKSDIYLPSEPVFLLGAILIFSITIFILLIKKKQLTWLGEIIVSYAKQCAKNDEV
ncbi:MAG: hypothetical protein FWD60_13435 [Candidatus Azobacteroides sp.]|nr:hypothetical protein [Candidatus Azobacteroides sp.]